MSSEAVTGEVMLVPPEPVAAVSAVSAERMIKLEPAVEAELQAQADRFATELVGLDPRSEQFEKKLDAIRTVGLEEIRRAAAAPNRMLDRPLKAIEAGGSDASASVSTSMVQLRHVVEDLDPSRQGLLGSAPRKLLGVIPYGNRLRSYFAKYSSGQKQLNAVLNSLYRGQDELRKDNAAIEQDKAGLWVTMERLRKYAALTQRIDASLESRTQELAARDPDQAKLVRTEVQFQVRQKQQDLLTQLAVSVQGYLAMDIVRKNNMELIKGVDRATTTTVSALRTAIIVAQALVNQKLVLNQIMALNTTTGNLIEATSEMLRDQTGAIYNQAAGASVSLEKLQAAFANVYAAIDSIDTYKLQAVESMRSTANALSAEVAKARTYLEKADMAAGAGELALP
jgi:uncharacterized protein YaaN involved in tellurite resistance